jgi:hypothetical protein
VRSTALDSDNQRSATHTPLNIGRVYHFGFEFASNSVMQKMECHQRSEGQGDQSNAEPSHRMRDVFITTDWAHEGLSAHHVFA